MYFPLSLPFPLPLKQFLIARWRGTYVVNKIISFLLHSFLKTWLAFTLCFNIKRDNIPRLANICFNTHVVFFCCSSFVFTLSFVCLFVVFLLIHILLLLCLFVFCICLNFINTAICQHALLVLTWGGKGLSCTVHSKFDIHFNREGQWFWHQISLKGQICVDITETRPARNRENRLS